MARPGAAAKPESEVAIEQERGVDRMTDLMAFGYKPRRVARPGAAAKPESEVAIEQERGVATEARVVEEIVVRPELLPRIEAWRQFG